jgi:DTW domain-containing protein YfiP
MQRFHDPRNDPLPMHSPQHEIERARLARQMDEFLARGGRVQEIGHCMSSAPATFTINPERSPVYAHLFATVASERAAEPGQTDDQRLAALIMAEAALGNSPRWIAKKYHMTEKHVRQIARDAHVTFHAQR